MNYPDTTLTTTDAVKDVLKPILYADIFDYPLTLAEVHKYLEFKVTMETVKQLLDKAVKNGVVAITDGFYTLPDKTHLVKIRQKRWEASQKLWPKALYYGQWIASLPFIRMVSITGSLSVNNPRDGIDDIDYLVVTEPNRLWLCRAMMILMVKFGHKRGVHLCPNYIITENVIFFEENNLYTAREMLQMIPIYGETIYRKMWAVNNWVTDFLPQANQPNLEKINDSLSIFQRLTKSVGELMLKGFVGNLLEGRLQTLQITKHTRLAQKHGASDNVTFTADTCKGHYDGHNNKTMQAYQQRVTDYRVKLNGN